MGKRGRPRASWQYLRDRGAKPSVWKKRKLEDEPPQPEVVEAPAIFTPDPDAVVAYVAAIKCEWDTFSDRCVEGETTTRIYGSGIPWPDAGGQDYAKHGAQFRFAEGPLRSVIPNLLQECKDFAEESLASAECGEWTKELCSRFLRYLSTLNDFVFDVEACKNVERMLGTFADPDKFIPMLRKLAIVEFMSWKHRSTGEPRFDDSELLNFFQDDMDTMDRAFAVLQAAVEAAA